MALGERPILTGRDVEAPTIKKSCHLGKEISAAVSPLGRDVVARTWVMMLPKKFLALLMQGCKLKVELTNVRLAVLGGLPFRRLPAAMIVTLIAHPVTSSLRPAGPPTRCRSA